MFRNLWVPKWVHYGLTSTDVWIRQGYRLKQANEIIRRDLETFKQTLAIQAKYKYTVDRTYARCSC